jgi:hypothetical protein
MTVEPGWIPPGIDTTKANVARVYDYWLGGDHNFQADRDLARTIIALDPNIRTTMRANRAFLGRVVRFPAGQAGIRQFLDIGSGIPTENEPGLVWIPNGAPTPPTTFPRTPPSTGPSSASPATTAHRPLSGRGLTDPRPTRLGSGRDPTGRFGVPVPVRDDEVLFTEPT